MKDLLKRLANQTATYGVSSILARIIPFLLITMHTKVLSPADYGVYNEFYTWVTLFIPLYTLGMETTFFRFSINNDGTIIYRKTATIVTLFSFFLSSILYIFSTELALIIGQGGYEHFIKCIAVILFLDALMAVPLARLRLENKAIRFAIVRLSAVVVNVLLQLFFLLLCPYIIENYHDTGIGQLVIEYYRESQLVFYIIIANLIGSLFTVFLLSKSLFAIRFIWDKPLFKEMMVFALPIIVIGIAGSINERMDNLMVKWWLDMPGMSSNEVIGVYGASTRLSVIILLAVQSFRYAAEPLFYSTSQDKNAKKSYATVLTFFTLFTTWAGVVIVINIAWLAPFFIKQQALLEAIHILPILLLARILFGIYANTTIWFKLEKKTYVGAVITVVGMCVFIASTYFLMPFIAFYAAPVSSCLCLFVMIFVNVLWSKRYYFVPYNWLQVVGIILLNSCIIFALENCIGDVTFIFSVFCSIIYTFVVFLYGFKRYKRAQF